MTELELGSLPLFYIFKIPSVILSLNDTLTFNLLLSCFIAIIIYGRYQLWIIG